MTNPQAPVAAPAPAAPAPVAAGAPAPAPVAPDTAAPADGQSATDAAGMDEVAWQIAAEADCKNSIVAEPGGGGGGQAPAPVPEQTAG